ncbi:MAG: lysostaphin resistance A-like protein [Terriglobia bacterium]
MTAERVFLAHGQVRPIWRFVLSVPLVFLAMYLADTAGRFIASPQDLGGWGRIVWSTLLTLPALLVVFKALSAVLDRKPLGAVGLAFCGRWRMELGIGLGIGSIMILAVGAAESALGLARFSMAEPSPSYALGWGGGVFVLLLVAATNEELMFRGYPFQRLADSIGAPAAVAVFSGLFGLVHITNPNHSAVSTVNTVLVGVPLAVAYLRTRALWLPVGIHFAWNFIQGVGLGLPISGFRAPISFLRAEVRGEALLTGGAYGPEASILCTIVIVAATSYLWRSRSIYISEAMRALVLEPPRSEPIAPATVVQLSNSIAAADSEPPKPE